MESNALARNFTSKGIIKYVLPTIFMMLFMSTYTIIDGIFVSHFVGETALSAVNIAWPVISMAFAIVLMFATGGVAIIGRFMGQGKTMEAKRFLSTTYILGASVGLIFMIFVLIFPEQIVEMLGADAQTIELSSSYLRTMGFFFVPFVLQVFVQTFFVTAGKPLLGFAVCMGGGFINILFDFLLISPDIFDLGIVGAGLATGLGNAFSGIFGVVYFLTKRKGTLYFCKPLMNFKIIRQSAFNGSSEMVSTLSSAIVTMILNLMLMSLVGTGGVAALSVILYVQMIQAAIYIGYSIGVAPIISFKYGEKNYKQLSNIVKTSLRFVFTVSIVVATLSVLFADFAVSIFIDRSSVNFEMAKQGFMIFATAYLFMGLNIFISSMFTSFSNGKISAFLSVLRTFVFTVTVLLILPNFLGIVGIWMAIPLAEGLTLIFSFLFYKKYKKTYKY